MIQTVHYGSSFFEGKLPGNATGKARAYLPFGWQAGLWCVRTPRSPTRFFHIRMTPKATAANVITTDAAKR